uniref:Ion_trans_2 domain-containing protein n=1 Tax=Rhabditophanes sp. KR3021 TaxID=114890 RepID=A0AC35TWR6_9BILA
MFKVLAFLLPLFVKGDVSNCTSSFSLYVGNKFYSSVYDTEVTCDRCTNFTGSWLGEKELKGKYSGCLDQFEWLITDYLDYLPFSSNGVCGLTGTGMSQQGELSHSGSFNITTSCTIDELTKQSIEIKRSAQAFQASNSSLSATLCKVYFVMTKTTGKLSSLPDKVRTHKVHQFPSVPKRPNRRLSSYDTFSAISQLKDVSEHLFINCILKVRESLAEAEEETLKKAELESVSQLLIPSCVMDAWTDGKSLFAKKKKMSWRKRILKQLTLYVQIFYERSRLKYFIPILILLLYSFAGGALFYYIESGPEAQNLIEKKNYMINEQHEILKLLILIKHKVQDLRRRSVNGTVFHNVMNKYRREAMLLINQKVYFYTLECYFLSDQETYKSTLLHPLHPEPNFEGHFLSPNGPIFVLKNYTKQLSERCWEMTLEQDHINKTELRLNEAIELFHKWTGLHHILTPTFTFWNSMFLAVTTYSTIGYGSVVPKSNLGRLAVMVYAVVGIPLVLLILHKLGRYFLFGLEYCWDMTIYLMESVLGFKDGAKYKSRILNKDRDTGMPVIVAILIAFGWMFLCAAIFLKFEKDWDYFKSFWFVFCSLTTIGYGDVTITKSEDMLVIFGFIIIGLSLVSMCINVCQLKLEEFVEEILLAIMEEYTGGMELGLSGTNLKARLNFIDMIKIWNRNKSKKKREKAAKKTVIVEDETSAKASFVNIREIMPFGKRRRVDELIHEIQRQLVLTNKSTQTEAYEHDYCKENKLVMDSKNDNTDYTVKFPEELLLHRVSITEGDPSDTMSRITQDVSYRHISSAHHVQENSSSSNNSGSVRSYPVFNMPNFNPKRRWTFIESSQQTKGAPRGLAMPAAFTYHHSNNRRDTSQIKSLIAEIDVRLKDCHHKLQVPIATKESNPESTEEFESDDSSLSYLK